MIVETVFKFESAATSEAVATRVRISTWLPTIETGSVRNDNE